jgi:Ni/Fe-hydrogenase subunit HybB-like protein
MRSHAIALPSQHWVNEKIFLGLTPRAYLRSLLTPGNLAVALILASGLGIITYRFVFGLAAVTNLSQDTPWGLWIGFDMLCGVALAAGGFTLASSVYLLGLKEYHPIVRPAVLTAFLGYVFAAIGLACDLGRPWNFPTPFLFSFGTTSVMFEVGWCVLLYTMVLAAEFTPSVFEWLGMKRCRDCMVKLTVGLTVAAVVLSTLHQASLGGLFLMAPHRIHPLWYSPFIPIFFFISAITAGLSMVIVESGLSHRAFAQRADHHVNLDRLTIGLARAAAVVLFTYFFARLQGLADGNHWSLLLTGWGAWYLVEVVGFVLVPSLVLAGAARREQVTLIRWTAAWVVLGVVVNRLNVSVIAFNWNVTPRYVPSVMEILTTVTLVTMGVTVFRWIVNRMPVLSELPEYRETR